ncbi:MAG: transporter [Bacteroidales bacterium]|nr:transporter [Bacteroidales bacterium]
MKKLFIISAALLIAVTASAQLKIEAAGNFGGLSNSASSNNPSSSFSKAMKSGFGFSGGLMYDINLLNNVLFLEPGVKYILNNMTIKDINEKMQTQWIQVPLSVGYGSSNGGFEAFLGLYYGRALKQDFEFNKNDFGFNAKIGYAFPVGLGIFFSYERGFLDLSQVSGYRAFNNLANFGLYFKFGRKE